MRGAGELLGNRQHGMIASVGFHLYTRLLAQAVRSQRILRGLPQPAEEVAAAFREGYIPVNVDLPIPVGIPVDYIPDQNMRLRIYRRLVNVHDEQEIDALEAEFQDRFGILPPAVQNLLFQLKVKLRAEKAGLVSVTVESDQLVLRFPPLPESAPARDLPALGPEIRTGKNAYWLPFASRMQDWRERLMYALSEIVTALPPSTVVKVRMN